MAFPCCRIAIFFPWLVQLACVSCLVDTQCSQGDSNRDKRLSSGTSYLQAQYNVLRQHNVLEHPTCSGVKPRVYMYELPATLRGDYDVCKEAASSQSSENSLQHRRICWNYPNFLFEYELWTSLKDLEVTKNPDDAEVFVVPAYFIQMYFNKRENWATCRFCAKRDDEIVTFLRSVGPYWNRFSGRDHLVTSLRCTKTSGSLAADGAFPQLWGNTMRACLEEEAAPGHYDLRSTIKVPYFIQPASHVLPYEKRNISVMFAGSMMPKRKWMRDAFPLVPRSKLEVSWDRGALTQSVDSLVEEMSRSQFVVAPPGDTPDTMRFIQAIQVGAIPIVANDYLRYPFDDMLPWSESVVRLQEAAVEADPNLLRETLAGIQGDKLLHLQESMMNITAGVTYGRKGMVADLVLTSVCKRFKQT